MDPILMPHALVANRNPKQPVEIFSLRNASNG